MWLRDELEFDGEVVLLRATELWDASEQLGGYSSQAPGLG